MSETMTKMMEPIEKVLERTNVKAVFGELVQEGEVTIIPVAEVGVFFGYGFGGTFGAGESSEGEQGGRGGGARGRATPRGYIHITPEGATFQPITNETIIPLAGIAMVAWAVFWGVMAIRAVASVFARRKK